MSPAWRARGLRVALLALLAMGASCAAPAVMAPVATAPAQPAAAPSLVTTAPAAALGQSPQAYMEIVQRLTSDEMEGRGATTTGLRRARDLLAEQFRSAGLEPAFSGSYLQPFDVPLRVAVEGQELAAAGRAAFQAEAGRHFSALGFSASGKFSAEAVFVGYGIDDPARKYDSYAGADAGALAGKVFIAFRYEPQDAEGVSRWTGRRGEWTESAALLTKAQAAARRGACALLIVNPAAHADDAVAPVWRGAMSGQLGIPVLHVTEEGFRGILGAAGLDGPAAGKKFQQQADGAGGSVVGLNGLRLSGSVTIRQQRANLDNVAGFVRGRGPLADQVVIVAAHYDHRGFRVTPARSDTQPARRVIFPGADDNASGAAGVVMLARRLVSAARAEGGAPARSVLLATFAGEELGLLGSGYLSRHLADAGVKPENVVAMVNMDMIGRLRDGNLHVWGVESGDRWRDMVQQAAGQAGLQARFTSSAYGPSDQLVFYRMKIPVLSFHTGAHLDVHRPTDTPDKVDPEGATKVLDVAETVVRRLRTDPEPPAYVPRGRAASAPAAAYLGIVPEDPPEGQTGCAVGQLVPGSPAEQGGLKVGDVIVRWDDAPIADSSGVLTGLAGRKPGDTVRLLLRRGGKDVVAEVKLGPRPGP